MKKENIKPWWVADDGSQPAKESVKAAIVFLEDGSKSQKSPKDKTLEDLKKFSKTFNLLQTIPRREIDQGQSFEECSGTYPLSLSTREQWHDIHIEGVCEEARYREARLGKDNKYDPKESTEGLFQPHTTLPRLPWRQHLALIV